MNEDRIRQIVQQEIQATASNKRFGFNQMPRHIHNGQDSPQLSQDNIIPSGCVQGTITFAQKTTYLLQLNNSFTPSRIDVHGNVTGASGEKAITMGLAILTPSFPFEPNSSTSVVTGSFQYPSGTPEFPNGNVPIQSSVYLSTKPDAAAGGIFHTIVGDGHISNVEYPAGTIHARATVVGFSKSGIVVTVSDLEAGWEMNINYTIT